MIFEREGSVLGAELVDALTDGRVTRTTLEAGLLRRVEKTVQALEGDAR